MKGGFPYTGNSARYDHKGREIAEEIDRLSHNLGGINIATNDIPGLVKPDGDTITIDSDGTLKGLNTFSDWESDKVYDVGKYRIANNQLYLCKTKHRSSSNFLNDIDNWELQAGSLSVSGTITGDGETTEFTITHGLRHNLVFCMLYDSDNELCLTDIRIIDENTITIIFGDAPETGVSYRFIINR